MTSSQAPDQHSRPQLLGPFGRQHIQDGWYIGMFLWISGNEQTGRNCDLCHKTKPKPRRAETKLSAVTISHFHIASTFKIVFANFHQYPAPCVAGQRP